MVNILRTPQVRAAQKGIPTGQVYVQNEQRLSEVGAQRLEEMLFKRDWDGLPSHAHKAKKAREKAERILREVRSGRVKLEDFDDDEGDDLLEVEVDHAALFEPAAQIDTSGMSEEDAEDARRRVEIEKILAMTEMMEKNEVSVSPENVSESIGMGKCPFTEVEQTAISAHEQMPPPSQSHQSPPTPPGHRQSELKRLVENEPQSVDEILRLAEEVEKWIQEN